MNEGYVMESGGGGLLAMLGAAFWLLFLGMYLVFSWLFYRIACNAGQKENAWWAFVPIVNIFLMLKAAGKPMWWFLLCLVPLVNIVILGMIWWKISEKCGQPGFWGILMMVPFINIVALLVLAFSSPKTPERPVPINPRPRQPVGV
jgi:hypothetical protein